MTLLFESPPSSQIAPVVEHVIAFGVERPIASFSRSLIVTLYLNKAIIQRQVVSDRVLPALFVLSVVGEFVHNELIDPV